MRELRQLPSQFCLCSGSHMQNYKAGRQIQEFGSKFSVYRKRGSISGCGSKRILVIEGSGAGKNANHQQGIQHKLQTIIRKMKPLPAACEYTRAAIPPYTVHSATEALKKLPDQNGEPVNLLPGIKTYIDKHLVIPGSSGMYFFAGRTQY